MSKEVNINGTVPINFHLIAWRCTNSSATKNISTKVECSIFCLTRIVPKMQAVMTYTDSCISFRYLKCRISLQISMGGKKEI